MNVSRHAFGVLVMLLGMLVLLGWLTFVLLAGGTRGAEMANVLALPVAILSVAIGAVLSRKGSGDESLGDAKAKLARSLLQEFGLARQRIMADSGESKGINLALTVPEQMPTGWRLPNGAAALSSSKEIGTYVEHLEPPRLIILGEAGSGKTALLFELGYRLLQRIQSGSAYSWIPLYISLADWPELPTSNQEETQRLLRQWLTSRLHSRYGLPASSAQKAVDSGDLLLLLDGLDEMDQAGDTPRRAGDVVATLNQATAHGLAKFVLTCRPTEFRRLTEEYQFITFDLSESVVIQDSGILEIVPLKVEQIIGHLKSRFTDPRAPGEIETRWVKLCAHLTTDPLGELAQVLSRPLYVFLLTVSFRGRESDPSTILETPDGPRHFLLRNAVPASCAFWRRRNGEMFPPDRVTRWLHILATNLIRRSDDRAKTVNTFTPVSSLPLIRTRTIKLCGFAIRIVSAAALYLLALPPDARSEGAWLIPFVVSAALGLLMVFSRDDGRYKAKKRVWRSFAARSSFLRTWWLGSLFALTYGGPVVFVIGLIIWVISGDLTGTAIPFFLSFLIGLVAIIGPIIAYAHAGQNAPDFVRVPSDVTKGLLIDEIIWVPLVIVGMALSLWANGTRPFAAFVVLMTCIVVAFVPLLTLEYLIASIASWWTTRSPLKYARFLDWACDCGLLRLSGSEVSFRHDDLLRWLACHDRQ